MEKKKVYLLFSGGLDSIIAAKLLKNLSYEVIGIHITSPFFQKNLEELKELAEKLSIELKIIEAGDDYLEMLKNPVYGYGKNINPCIDCKAYMLKKLKEIAGNNIIATGEVLGQRPMSQRPDAFRKIEKLSGLEGKILRPLSGKLLPPTVYEKEGMVEREKLLGLSGRSRKRYPEVLEKLGVNIEALPTPAGGCLLTDPAFAKKVKNLMDNDELTWENVRLLKIGRHFRIGDCKLVVGRNKKENELLKEYSKESDFLLWTPEVPGPTAILRCKVEPELSQLETAAGIVARYSDAKEEPSVAVAVEKNGKLIERFTVKPNFDTDLFAVR
jgi:tRNA U34 2-thiouridine synthase MnmA/TrmU